jgi:hypothetical protein
MLYRKPRVGQEINSYCGKCKIERTHIVAAMDGDVVRRVTCSMCHSTHNYKPAPGASAPRASAASAPKAQRASAGGSRRKVSTAFSIDPNRPVRSYDMNSMFSAGDVIKHPKFGLGAVETTFPPNKIEVRFEEGKKLLLHNMKNFRA